MPAKTIQPLSENQKRIIETIHEDTTSTNWRDWKWQMKHCIRDLDTFQELLEVNLSKEVKEAFKKTIDKFPMSITPYYLSLIDTDNIENDPVFKQSFPSPSELIITNDEMSDPLHEDKDRSPMIMTVKSIEGINFVISRSPKTFFECSNISPLTL